MRGLLIFLFIISSLTVNAQSWSPAVEGKKKFYTNGFHYLRMMMYDSVITNGTEKYFYPFKTWRGSPCQDYWEIETFDSNGASWWGKEIVITDTGASLFYNYDNEMIELKHLSDIDDEWVLFHSDSLNIVYHAKITALDTMTIQGMLDSIKMIKITTLDKNNNPIADSLDGLELILSKEHGLIRTLDWYMFPYRTDSFYKPSSIDCYYMQMLKDGQIYNVQTKGLIFNLVDLKSTSMAEMYDYEIGEVLHWQNMWYWAPSQFNYTYWAHKVVEKKFSDSFVYYTYIELTSGDTTYSSHSKYDFAIDSITFLPEKNLPDHANVIYYFNPKDSSFCYLSPMIDIFEDLGIFNGNYSGGLVSYKVGLGCTYRIYGNSQTFLHETLIRGAKKNTSQTPCWKNNNIISIGNVIFENTNQIKVYPNPASSIINIKLENEVNVYKPLEISIISISGKVIVKTVQTNADFSLDVNNLSQGVYYLKIKSSTLNDVKKIVIVK